MNHTLDFHRILSAVDHQVVTPGILGPDSGMAVCVGRPHPTPADPGASFVTVVPVVTAVTTGQHDPRITRVPRQARPAHPSRSRGDPSRREEPWTGGTAG